MKKNHLFNRFLMYNLPDEILGEIFGYVNDGQTYKYVVSSCKFWSNIMEEHHPNKKKYSY